MVEEPLKNRPALGKLHNRLERDISTTLAKSDEILHILWVGAGLTGATQAMVLTQDRVIIGKMGPLAGLPYGSLVTSFYLRDILSIQFNKKALGSWIEILTPAFQGNGSMKFSGADKFDDAWKRPNCFPISKSELATQMIQATRDQMTATREHQAPENSPGGDLAARLEKLAGLFSSGLLTGEEFKLAKVKLLET